MGGGRKRERGCVGGSDSGERTRVNPSAHLSCISFKRQQWLPMHHHLLEASCAFPCGNRSLASGAGASANTKARKKVGWSTHLIPRFRDPGRINLFHRFGVGSTKPGAWKRLDAETLPRIQTLSGACNIQIKIRKVTPGNKARNDVRNQPGLMLDWPRGEPPRKKGGGIWELKKPLKQLRCSSITQHLQFRRRRKSVCSVLDGLKNKACTEARSAALRVRWLISFIYTHIHNWRDLEGTPCPHCPRA